MATWRYKGKSVNLVRASSQYLRKTGLSFSFSTIFLRVACRLNFLGGSSTAYGSFCLENDYGVTGLYFYNYWDGINTFYYYIIFRTSDGGGGTLVYTTHGFIPAGILLREIMTFIWDGSHVAIYSMGTRTRYESISGPFVGTGRRFAIGSRADVLHYFNGQIDDVILATTIPSELASFPYEYEELGLTGPDFCERFDLTPDHMWTFENPDNLGQDTGTPGGWDLTAYNNPTQGDPVLGELVDDPAPLIAEAWLDCEYSPAQMDLGTFLFHARGNGGVPPYTYMWAYSNDHGNRWFYRSVRDNTLLVENILPGEYWYKCRITDAEGNTDESEIIKVRVYVGETSIYYPQGTMMKAVLTTPLLRAYVKRTKTQT